jgi:hypothetical protein
VETVLVMGLSGVAVVALSQVHLRL